MEDDKLLTERILILIRNILDIPATPDDDKRTDDDASVHDQVQLFPLSYRTHFRCTIILLYSLGALVHASLWNGRCHYLFGIK